MTACCLPAGASLWQTITAGGGFRQTKWDRIEKRKNRAHHGSIARICFANSQRQRGVINRNSVGCAGKVAAQSIAAGQDAKVFFVFTAAQKKERVLHGGQRARIDLQQAHAAQFGCEKLCALLRQRGRKISGVKVLQKCHKNFLSVRT